MWGWEQAWLMRWASAHYVALHIAYGGLVGGQITLLGIWAGFSDTRWPAKTAGLVVGVWYLCLLLFIMIAGHPVRNILELVPLITLIAIPTLMVTGVCLFARCFYARIVYRPQPAAYCDLETFRYSLRHLLLAMLIVAGLLAWGRVFRSQVLHSSSMLWYVIWASNWCLVFGICTSALALLTVWAGLGRHQTSQRLPMVLFLSTQLGLIPLNFFGDTGWQQLTWQHVVTWQGIAICLTLSVVGSLWIVRLCGYRLVAERTAEPVG